MDDGQDSAWETIASHDEAAAVIATVLELDTDAEYTKTELSDAAGVPLKSLYLDGTLDAIVDLGLLEKRAPEGEEPLYAVAADGEAFTAAAAFERACRAEQVESI